VIVQFSLDFELALGIGKFGKSNNLSSNGVALGHGFALVRMVFTVCVNRSQSFSPCCACFLPAAVNP